MKVYLDEREVKSVRITYLTDESAQDEAVLDVPGDYQGQFGDEIRVVVMGGIAVFLKMEGELWRTEKYSPARFLSVEVEEV